MLRVIQFETHFAEIEVRDGEYFVSGRNAGSETIRVGDSLNGLIVSAIEAYGNALSDCPPGMGATLTLIRSGGAPQGRYDLPLMLRADRTQG
jgi:hypothetical protein